jgi:hypothetical protein
MKKEKRKMKNAFSPYHTVVPKGTGFSANCRPPTADRRPPTATSAMFRFAFCMLYFSWKCKMKKEKSKMKN